MPQQRNHPHHHSTAERAARAGGLQLPQLEMSPRGFQQWSYPVGWVKRPFWRSESRRIRIAGFVWAAILVAGFVVFVASR